MLSPAAAQWAAILILVGLALAPILWLAWQIRRTPLRPTQTLLWWLNYAVARSLWRGRVIGRLDIPDRQGAVIVCNHRSSVDPCFVHLATQRVIHWMVAREYCGHPAYRWLLRACEVIPTNRTGVDAAAAKAAIDLVRAGGLVGIFPEGRLNTTDRPLLPVLPGAVLIALKAHCPIVPCYIEGSPTTDQPWQTLLRRSKVTLRIGEPIDLSRYYGCRTDRQLLAQLTAEVMRAVLKLGGHEQFVPQVRGAKARRLDDDLLAGP